MIIGNAVLQISHDTLVSIVQRWVDDTVDGKPIVLSVTIERDPKAQPYDSPKAITLQLQGPPKTKGEELTPTPASEPHDGG